MLAVPTVVGNRQSKTSFTLVSIIIIIHNVINNKEFFIYSIVLNSLESLHSDSFDGERLLCHFYRIADICN